MKTLIVIIVMNKLSLISHRLANNKYKKGPKL
jgi:hypothetical protein